MHKRITDGNISFDLYKIEADGTETFLKNFTKRLSDISSPEYSTRQELINNEGENLQYWAEDVIKYEALKIAGRDVGMSEEDATADLDETELYTGGSFKAKNIDGQPYNFRDEGDIEDIIEIPSDVIGNIEVILREMKDNLDNVDYVDELKKELDRILSRNDLNREDIRDLIENRGLESVLL